MAEILMSVKPQYVQKMLSGEKTVELRSRRLNVKNGSRVWIYSTLPKGCIEAVATIKSIEYSNPKFIWSIYSRDLAITEEEFIRYSNNCEKVSAITLADVMEVTSPISLALIRSYIRKFQPPQFFSHLTSDMELSNLLMREGLG